MGITIAYRGQLSDLTKVDDFEDRLVDLALQLGGQVQIWRSWTDDDPGRMVRGVLLNLAPGQETTSLLVSPEGWLIGMAEIENAEEGRLSEPPLCFVKTQFGPIDGHVALVEMFAQLKRNFLPDLEVWDDGGYWEKRDFTDLVRKFSLTQRAIDGLAAGLQQYGLSHEAAEDPHILERHVVRVAQHVHRTLMRPAEHAPSEFVDDLADDAADSQTSARQWEEIERDNRRRQERIQRAIQEGLSRGLDPETALDQAMGDADAPSKDEDESSAPENELSDEAAREAEPWREGENSAFDDWFESETDEVDADESANDGKSERHPLLRRSTELFLSLTKLCGEESSQTNPALTTLYQGAADLCGGLAQALSFRKNDVEIDGLRVVQFKRALRGAAFARGAIYSLGSRLAADRANELIQSLEQMETDIFAEMAKLHSQEDER
jgi:hypothetical protein